MKGITSIQTPALDLLICIPIQYAVAINPLIQIYTIKTDEPAEIVIQTTNLVSIGPNVTQISRPSCTHASPTSEDASVYNSTAP